MARCKQFIIPISATENNLINDVFDLGAVLANDTDKNNTISNELFNQSIKSPLISIPAVQNKFLWVRHEF